MKGCESLSGHLAPQVLVERAEETDPLEKKAESVN